MLRPLSVLALVVLPACVTLQSSRNATDRARACRSHPPIRKMLPVGNRPKTDGPSYFVDPAKGDDGQPGSKSKPWRTINASLNKLKPGDTLYLRAGTYFESVYCAVAGTEEKPITVRAYPTERVVIDGGIPEFQTDPAGAWEPFEGGAEGEYVSTRDYRNIRDVVGLFGDSNIGLQTYWDTEFLRATDEFEASNYGAYCGPGLWYDKLSGKVHVRLAHTHLPPLETYQYENVNYRGETDPRKIPLVVAPFRATPLLVDQAMNVRFQDLVIRGGGYRTVYMLFGVNIAFDNCTFYGGTYTIWSKSTGPLKMTNCGVHGMIPPWGFRDENGLKVYSSHVYPPFIPDKERGRKHISRLPTHAVLVTEGGFEFETFYYPHNHHWEIANCEFTDGHDGVYLSGYDIKFHHNWLDRVQDDGVYISAPTSYFNHSVYVYQNYISGGVSGIGAHSYGGPGGDIYVYRNVFDLRRPMHAGRPTPKKPGGTFWFGHSVYFRHGRGFLHGENLTFYHNTCLIGGLNYLGAMWNTGGKSKGRVFNNLAIYRGKYSLREHGLWNRKDLTPWDLELDGNLHYSLASGDKVPADYLEKIRTCLWSEGNKKHYPAGFAAQSIVGNPKVKELHDHWTSTNDYRLEPGSPAKDAGVKIPKEWLDPLRDQDQGKPDIGALPMGTEQLRVGVRGRIIAGDLSGPKESAEK